MDFQTLYYLAAVLTAVVGTYLAESVRRKNKADEAQSLTDAAMKMVDAKDRELDESRKERSVLRLYIGYLLTGITVLRSQLTLANIKPGFEPESLEEYKK